MSKLPQPFWAIMLALFGLVIGLACLFHPNADNSITLQIISLASNLVSGALGAFAGHAVSQVSKPDATVLGNDPPPQSGNGDQP